MTNITYIIGTDHAGRELGGFMIELLQEKGLNTLDLRADSLNVLDYPDYAKIVCEKMLQIPESKGILICGSGIGMSIAANRYKHIRAALCTDSYMASMARAHNDANVLCLGERVIGKGKAQSIIEAFIRTEFDGGRHSVRVEKLGHLGDSI